MEAGKLTHSHSQPGGMDRTPPGTPKKGGKMLAVRVQMLDDTITMFQVQAKALGRVLFEQVCNQLHLLESDYFGLEYQEMGGTKYWLDLEKPLSRQIGLSLVDTLVRFCVKFYTPDPSQLEEEFTRYLFCLQIKRDLSQGLLQCNSNTAALLASYIVQAECGDYVVEDYPDHRYLSSYKFVPNQDQELERKIMENHKKHAGQSPAEADLNLLETARRCELYGIKMHPAKDHEGAPLNLAVAHMGIVVFQNFTKINTFSWAKIRKISFKRKRFLVKLHPEGYGHYKDTVEFFFEGRNECKNFWKKCVENHGFFRCTMVKKVPRQKTRVLSRGSSFRYSGRTQKQIVDFVRENYVKRQTFQRSQSFRHSSSAHSSVANVGTSISAHPLLPLGDNAVAGTPASLSCGSMTLTSSPLHTADIHAGGSPSPPLTTSVSPGTSVTSSPQHFYPQETPYRRAGRQLTKTKHPHVRSHRAISPLQSPTDAATSASNRSANLSKNNNIIIDGNDIQSSRVSLKSPDYANFNDVYSTCYSSLRSSRNNVDNKVIDDEETKAEIFNLGEEFVNTSSQSNDSIRSLSKKLKPLVCKNDEDEDRYTWHRSASCKDLYREENVMTEDKNDNNLNNDLEPVYDVGYDFPVTRYDNSRRKCYSAVTSKNPSVDRTGEVISEMKIYSSSYPGTTSSLSTESAEGEPEERIIEMIGVKYDSQEEMVLSHDDVSHDSYELLERELEDYNDAVSRSQTTRCINDNERARSCSWGSDRGMSPMDSRSTENVVSLGYGRSRENSFWSLERERSPKHKSEADFRSLNYKPPKGSKNRNEEYRFRRDAEERRLSREFLDYDSRCAKRMKEASDEVYGMPGQLDNRLFGSNYVENELYRNYEQELRLPNIEDEDMERKNYEDWTKSLEELMAFQGDSDEGILKGRQIKIEDRRRMERKRDKREKDERFHEGIKEKEQIEWERERERRQLDRKKMAEEKARRTEEETARKMQVKPNDYANFQEIHFKKFERVVSNQFGKYSEFLPQENTYEYLQQERKVMENYEKICQVGRMAKELKENEKNALVSREYRKVLSEKPQENTRSVPEIPNSKSPTFVGQFPELEKAKPSTKWGVSPRVSPRTGKALVERTTSDPFNNKNQRRNILMHQKSIDLTPQQSEENASDFDNEDGLKKTSRSEHDIPYILHKRHCMNGTAKNKEMNFTKTDFKTSLSEKISPKEIKSPKTTIEGKKPIPKDLPKKPILESGKLPKKVPSAKPPEGKKSAVQIINLDIKNDASHISIIETKKVTKPAKPTVKKPESKLGSPKTIVKKEIKKLESPKPKRDVTEKIKKEETEVPKPTKPIEKNKSEEKKEPIYAEVCKEKIEPSEPPKKIPPEPPKRTSSVSQKPIIEEKEKTSSIPTSVPDLGTKSLPKPPKRSSSIQKPNAVKPEGEKDIKTSGTKIADSTSKETESKEEQPKVQLNTVRGKPDLPFASSVLKRREESLILFARTRLGLSEGSAFTPISRQGHVGSPSSARRTRSLDAPYVSVHSLPPVDAFSSKDDTVDSNEGDVVCSAVTRAKELFKTDLKKVEAEPSLKTLSAMDTTVSESEMDSVFVDNLEADPNFKKTVESQSKIEIAFPEEKVLDVVRSKRLLSKIESVDVIDSEGDLDSSKLADPPPIPSDRMVNLPESIRFPSVRQISGQTSEESADGWDQKEVKVKRRTPRRSVGREDASNDIKESVVWDSKDDEPPDDDVWDDNLVFTGKYEGSTVTDAVVPVEYLKRGSCGQSIDDDNLSTPMKESSPEHWVSVDDLPEALEREEKLLRQQEKVLREKIFNEKLKRELNLDTVDVDERYYEHKDNFKQMYEDDTFGLKDKFKGHSLDTYELKEKKLRERGTIKNSSLDEHLLGDKPIKNYNICSSLGSVDKSSYDNVVKATNYQGIDYIQCKVVNDVTEIDQFGDNDEELEEFFVVLDENLGNEKDGRDLIWEEDEIFKRSVSKEESLISVPEEFKDVEKEPEEAIVEKQGETISGGKVEIRLSEVEGRGKRLTGEEHILASQLLQEKLDLVAASEKEEEKSWEDPKLGVGGDIGLLSPYNGSRRGSEEHKKLAEDTGRLSPYDCSSRRSSEDPRRLSASDDAGRLSPFNDSRRGSEDPRRLSTSEDSRKYSMSESVSEETRRRLSSTEETRRKRASLTKQCSVGADSLSDEMISGIQECSSSFEHDEKDVFESEPVKSKEAVVPEIRQLPSTVVELAELSQSKLEIEVSEDISSTKEDEQKPIEEANTIHLAPPSSERELSRETEDSVDYCEGDFKDIREAVKEKDISEGLICDNEPIKLEQTTKLPSSFEKSESSDIDELRYIDEKRGSTPEIIVGKSREAVAMSIVIVNEGISVLNKISEKGQWLTDAAKAHSLPRELKVDKNDEQRHTLPKKLTKPKTPPKPVDYVHRKLGKAVPNVKVDSSFMSFSDKSSKESLNILKSSLDSSQESDIDKLGEVSLISYVHSQIARRNLSDTGKGLRHDELEFWEKEEKKTSSEEDGLPLRASSEERERTESSSFELKSSADELCAGDDGKWKPKKGEKKFSLKTNFESGKTKKELTVSKEKRSPDQEKRDSGEDGSSSSSAPPHPKRELSSTWKPFLLESSGSSSLEEGWLPPDDNAHLADEEETSSTSNNQQDDSYHDDIDYPTGIGYPVLNMSSAEMMVGGYGGVYALSRTLSRISERSTSEQERSDIEDDITKPSSHSVSAEEESIISSDHQPSLSSDPPSPREITSGIPDLPDDRPSIEGFVIIDDKKPICEPFGDVIPPPVPDDDWPSPPSSSSVADTPVVSHIETFYIEIHPEEACKVVVAEPNNGNNSSSDENQTLQEESEFLHLSSDNISASTTTTTQDGTVIVPVRPKSVRTGSVSEDTSIVSTSDWSNSIAMKARPSYSEETARGSGSLDSGSKVGFKRSIDDVSDWSSTTCQMGGTPKYYSENYSELEQQKPKITAKIKPPKLVSPTTKNIGFFETPVSKVRSPTSQMRFFESGDRGGSCASLRSPTSHSETTSPKSYGRFFDGSSGSSVADMYDLRSSKGKYSSRREKPQCHGVCTPYYSNVADSAEKSYFGRYDTGSLERTKIHSSRKCCSYYSVSRATPHEEDSDGSNSDGPPPPAANTIPRASKKTRRRHRVAMDLEIRNGKIVAPPKTITTVIDNSDSDRSSPREFTSRDRKKHSDV